MSYTLYGVNVSPFVRKVRIYMAEKGLSYDHDPVNPFSPPDNYRQLSPLGKIPALTDGDKPLADSSIICSYLERMNPEPALYPSDHYDFARTLWFEEYCDGAMIPKTGPNVFVPLVLAPVMQNQPVTDAIRETVAKFVDEEINPMWDYLEEELGDKEFFVGDMLTVADIAVSSTHVNLFHAGVDVDSGRWPKLAAFVGRMFARPSVAAMIDEETPTWGRRDAA